MTSPTSLKLESGKLLKIFGVPDGIRTRVTAVKGRCPGPLDDGDALVGESKLVFVLSSHLQRYQYLRVVSKWRQLALVFPHAEISLS